jgi:UDP-N-acetylmuramoyl-tripeptide--D-alanyl-D-alanine ligase
MESMRLADVAAAVGGSIVGNRDTIATGVSIDSRTLRAGDAYVAIRGKRLDGHQFVTAAVRAGASAVVVESAAAAPPGVTVIFVDDTTRALGRIAAWYRGRMTVRCVAVTGSNGKTTTKEMLGAILASRYRTLRPKGSFNNDIGVPLTVLEMDRSTEAAIFEIEMNELGGTARLAAICRPEVGVITNIGDTHLEFMRDRQGVAQEKAELLQALPASGTAVLNADDELVMAIGEAHAPARRLTFGIRSRADFHATAIEDLGLDGTRFRLAGCYPVRLPLPGRHNILNCLAACAAAAAAGIETARMPAALEQFEPPPLRLRVRRVGQVTLVEDCYNANPQSMRAALDVLARSTERGRCIAFLGDMLELGGASEREHELLGRAASRVVSRLVLVGQMAGAVEQGAAAAGFDRACVWRYATSTEVSPIDLIRPGDTILVKGSRATAMELISQEIVRHYEQQH